MNEIKLPDSELKVMVYLWDQDGASAREAAVYMDREYGWKKNTTYTVLKNLQAKGVIERLEPGFHCMPLIEREQVGRVETKNLVDRFYQGSISALFSAFLKDQSLSAQELEALRHLIDKA